LQYHAAYRQAALVCQVQLRNLYPYPYPTGMFPALHKLLACRQLVEAQAALGSDKTKFLAVHHGEQVLVKDGRLLNTPRCISV